jgi:hypothetical protein
MAEAEETFQITMEVEAAVEDHQVEVMVDQEDIREGQVHLQLHPTHL